MVFPSWASEEAINHRIKKTLRRKVLDGNFILCTQIRFSPTEGFPFWFQIQLAPIPDWTGKSYSQNKNQTITKLICNIRFCLSLNASNATPYMYGENWIKSDEKLLRTDPWNYESQNLWWQYLLVGGDFCLIRGKKAKKRQIIVLTDLNPRGFIQSGQELRLHFALIVATCDTCDRINQCIISLFSVSISSFASGWSKCMCITDSKILWRPSKTSNTCRQVCN